MLVAKTWMPTCVGMTLLRLSQPNAIALDRILKLHKHAAHMGMENAEAIAAVEGIDMIAYGHSDLSARLGVHLQLEHPNFKAAVRRIAEACKAHGKLARGSAETEAQIEEYWRLGYKVLNLPGTDVSTYLDGVKARGGRAHARVKSIGVPVP
jgi:2-keto-3-deoxy-L-rhamnonate aldolase RhmA